MLLYAGAGRGEGGYLRVISEGLIDTVLDKLNDSLQGLKPLSKEPRGWEGGAGEGGGKWGMLATMFPLAGGNQDLSKEERRSRYLHACESAVFTTVL